MIFSAKRDIFLEMLCTIAENVKESAQYFVDFKIKNEADLKEFATKMKEYETKGDKYIHEIIVALNKTFITPLEREDILELANTMDDILDGMEQCASRFEMYNITQTDNYMIDFAKNILESTEEVAKSARLLNKKKLMDIRPHAIKINDLESQCDDLLRTCIKELFIKEKDPIKIIQYKELYEIFESISDSCEDVADTLETIIMRNA
jgi:predicted phosphate transport protein (TIGR00153 family)